jgi:hypothetical protein
MTKKTIYIVAGSILVSALALGSVATSAHSLISMGGLSDTVKSALTTKDIDKVKSALKEDANKKIDNLTQDQINEMSDKLTKKENLKKAIEENNYENFKSISGNSNLTQDQFNKIVENSKKQKEFSDKILTAVKNNEANGFEEYKTVLNEIKTYRDSSVDSFRMKMHQNTNQTLTDEQIKTQYQKLVDYYKANGNLPEKGFGELGGFGKKGDFGGKRGRNQGMNQNENIPNIF